MRGEPVSVGVSEFVALLNQTLEFAYPAITVTGEIANFRVSKNRWVYFDLKDENASVKFFGTVYQMPGPLEDGMMVAVRGIPRLHPLYGFSVTIQSVTPTGEGAIKKAAALLEAKLRAEGLFDEARKRPLPYPPRRIALITSGESAAYRDFMKIIAARWGGVHISHIDVQVQGEPAPAQIAAAIRQSNEMIVDQPEAIVIIRGGGSAEDLQAFSTEQVVRAVAVSRIPTLVAIGHEVDVSLAELAADVRASTPSNAAELLVPDKQEVLRHLHSQRRQLSSIVERSLHHSREQLQAHKLLLYKASSQVVQVARETLALHRRMLEAYNPQVVLSRGYALIRKGDAAVRQSDDIAVGDKLQIQLSDADVTTTVENIIIREEKNDAKNR